MQMALLPTYGTTSFTIIHKSSFTAHCMMSFRAVSKKNALITDQDGQLGHFYWVVNARKIMIFFVY